MGPVPAAMAAGAAPAICTRALDGCRHAPGRTAASSRRGGDTIHQLRRRLNLFPQSALNPGVRKREVFGWAMYDFANSGYTTVVITAVFAAYFVGGIAGGASWATFAWTAALSISYAIVMATMPAIGAWADRHAPRSVCS